MGRDSFNRGFDRKLVTTFVDCLPFTVTKRELFKEFGKYGFIKDIYISRRKRQQTDDTFAFVRFWDYGSAMRAIKRLNGTSWQGHLLSVSMSKYRREGNWSSEKQDRAECFMMNKGQTKKWVPMKKDNTEGADVQKNVEEKQTKNSNNRKEIQDFRKVMNQLLDEWSGPGEIESRDVALYRCLITFSSPEIRDNALNDELLLSIFDEGKMVLIDDRAEESKSSSVAREFGSELYSLESHPDTGDSVSETIENTESMKLAAAPTVEEGTSPATARYTNLNPINFEDPLIEVIMNKKLDIVHHSKDGRENDGEVHGNGKSGDFQDAMGGYEFMGSDAATHEAHIVFGLDLAITSPKWSENGLGVRIKVMEGPTDSTESISDDSYPYPPCFGPGLDHAHSHNELCPQFGDAETGFVREKREFHTQIAPSEVGESSKIGDSAFDDEERSDETLYKINEKAFRNALVVDNDEAVKEAEVTSVWKAACTVQGQGSAAAVVNDDVHGTLIVDLSGRLRLGFPSAVEPGAESPNNDEDPKSPQNGVWVEQSNDLSGEDDSTEVGVAREL
ncbi:hypothetical protein PIB30_033223 [Stylosanthes scabra]|uniref:RRM domain-containing protein n=1 Tax=Stylosanthes scabra TaxID=79078 RepID=A0ABU6UB74_9FABA|nr:hypothetical protein [Stylosanthes scabra]